jgi:hypothetical protein
MTRPSLACLSTVFRLSESVKGVAMMLLTIVYGPTLAWLRPLFVSCCLVFFVCCLLYSVCSKARKDCGFELGTRIHHVVVEAAIMCGDRSAQ